MAENKILIVEDNWEQMERLESRLTQENWKILKCASTVKAFQLLQTGLAENDLPHLVSIDLGLGEKPRDPDEGLLFLAHIRRYPAFDASALPIVVHSGLQNLGDDVVHFIMSRRASYFHLDTTQTVEGYIAALPLLLQGYIIYSPRPASILQRAVTLSDPFFGKTQERLWHVARLCAQDKTYAAIAKTLNGKERGIKQDVHNIIDRLEIAGGIPYQAEKSRPGELRQVIKLWYLQNRWRDPSHHGQS